MNYFTITVPKIIGSVQYAYEIHKIISRQFYHVVIKINHAQLGEVFNKFAHFQVIRVSKSKVDRKSTFRCTTDIYMPVNIRYSEI